MSTSNAAAESKMVTNLDTDSIADNYLIVCRETGTILAPHDIVLVPIEFFETNANDEMDNLGIIAIANNNGYQLYTDFTPVIPD